MLKKILLVGAIALGVSSVAFASGDTFKPAAKTFTPGIYVGIQGGYSLADWNSVDGNRSVLKVKNYNDFAGRVYAGFDAFKYLAFEAGYTQFFNRPEISNIANVPVTSTQPSAYGTYAVDIAAKLKAPITDDFGLYAKIGGDYLSVDEGLDGKEQSAFNVLFGLGATYYFTPNFTVDFSWTRYNGEEKTDNTYIPTYDLFAAGIAYKFNIG